MKAEKDIKGKFLSNFVQQQLSAEWVKQNKVTQEAQLALGELAMPTTRDEYWKYTRVNKIVNDTYTQSPSFEVLDVEEYQVSGLTTNLLVFVNGYFSDKLSNIIEGNKVTVLPMAKARKEFADDIEEHYGAISKHKSEIFTALNTVYNTNGVFVKINDGVVLEHPVHILHLTNAENAAFNPRNLFVAGKNSQGKIISSYETISGGGFTNSVTEIFVGKDAHLSYYLYQNQSETSKQVSNIEVVQKSNSVFTAFTLTLDGQLVRNNLNIAVQGEHVESNLFGLYLLDGKRHVDNHTYVDHIEPNCNSNELYRGVLGGHSTGVFNGKVFVHKEAQKTNAFQANNNVLLSDTAKINSKPELEIYADDVKCSHGCTIGQLDEEAIYYLRARGVKATSARNLVVKAFVQDVIDKVDLAPLKEKLEAIIDERLDV